MSYNLAKIYEESRMTKCIFVDIEEVTNLDSLTEKELLILKEECDKQYWKKKGKSNGKKT